MEMSLLSCPVCLKPHFQGVDALRSSLINVATTHISCPVCSESLLGLDKLTIHLFSHISNNKTSQDSSSQTSVISTTEIEKISTPKNDQHGSTIINVTEDVEMMEKSYRNLPLLEGNEMKQHVTCDICTFNFSDETILDLHQKLLHQTIPDKKTGKYNYHCHLCSKQFKMRGSLMVHLRVAHFGFIHNNHRKLPIYINKSDDINVDNINPHLHNKRCNMKNHIEEETVGLLISSQHSSGEKNKILSVSTKNQDNKQWECEVCLKMFTTKYFLKKHKRLHTGEMPYFCMQCNKYFTFQQSYHKHMLYHSDDKPHICSECGRAFKELSTLHNHERIHSGERPFSCETCGKSFRQRVSYLVHRRIHTGAMPYKCTACNKSFRYKVSQRSHKCPINPPGCVVRTPDLVEKLIRNQKANISKITGQNTAVISDQPVDAINLDFTAKHDCMNHDINADVKNIIHVSAVASNFNFEQNLKVDPNINVASNYLNQSNLWNEIHHNDCNELQQTDVTNRQENISIYSDHPSKDIEIEKNDTVATFSSHDNENPDFFALILSPVLSNVQSLCLSNYKNAQNDTNKQNDNISVDGDTLETINEESFKELLYGPK